MDKSSYRPVIAAAAVATCMMFALGLGSRVVATRLAAAVTSLHIAQEALDQLPLQIGDWSGENVLLDEAIIRQTDTDAHVYREYFHRNGLASVSFYVAGGVRARDLMPHRPEVCYTGSGWTLMNRRTRELILGDGTRLPCNVFQFSRGILSTEKTVVLYYYIVDGRHCADVSSLRAKVWRGPRAIGYVAQVEIVATVTGTLSSDLAENAVSEFAVESALPVAELFRHVQEGSRPGEPVTSP